ncbi:MAG: metal ABC transporter ATP-binding protein [Anaerolineales bacterium]|nr:metal ABC transporter ATP-binding protein [Anaerolineales bacterium]
MSPNIRHQENQPVLDVHKLSVRYNGRLALDNLTFHLHAGERIAVVGPNGAGKSTLFKVVAGVLTPSSGEVNIYGSGPRGHVCIGYVPQRSQVDWRFPVTVADVAMMGRVARLGWLRMPGRKDWELVHSALSMVGLDDLHDRQISQLSGGQQQRMFIARALAQEAALMLMDEPFAGLDLPSREEILDLLDKLKSQSVTVMVATHDLEEAARYFDRIMLLNQRMFGFGTADIVLQYDRLRAAYGERLRQVDEDAKEWTVADTCCGEGETNGNAH